MTPRLPAAVCVVTASLLCAAAVPAALSGSTGTVQAQVQATTVEPRAFGWRVGDIVRRRVIVEVPSGLSLDATALPPLGRHGTALELRDLARSSHRHLDGSHREELRLAYQVFQSPPEVRTFELPALRLVFKGEPQGEVVQVAPWPVSVTPLTPLEPSERRGLGDFRPDAEPPSVPTAALRNRIAVSGVAMLMLIGYLAVVYVGLPWRRASRRPFQVALAQVRRMQESSADGAVQESSADGAVQTAFRAVHAALNQTAGHVLFDRDLDRLVATEPRYAGLRDALVEFYVRSRAVFFAGADTPADRVPTLRWLVDLCRRLRDAERGSP